MATLNLLLPVDFSNDADVALRLAVELAEHHRVHAELIHVLEQPNMPAHPMSAPDVYGELKQTMRQQADNQLTELQQHLWMNNVEAKATLLVDSGHGPGYTLAEYAERQQVDLVVAVSKHASGLEKLLIGTELLRIIRKCRIPVLVLSPNCMPRFDRMLYATDFSAESVSVLGRALKFAQHFGASMTCTKINTPGDFMPNRVFSQASRELREQLSELSLDHLQLLHELVLYNEKDVPEGIVHCAEDHLTDLIVLATHGRRGFSRLLNGSVSEEVIHLTHRPVLVFHLPED